MIVQVRGGGGDVAEPDNGDSVELDPSSIVSVSEEVNKGAQSESRYLVLPQ